MSISFKFRRGELISLPVFLRHRRQCTPSMLLDTGAQFTVLDTGLAEKIGLETRGATETELIGLAGSAGVPVATLDEAWLLSHVVRNLRVICQPLDPRMGFEGILGVDFLRHFNFTVDNEAEEFLASWWDE